MWLSQLHDGLEVCQNGDEGIKPTPLFYTIYIHTEIAVKKHFSQSHCGFGCYYFPQKNVLPLEMGCAFKKGREIEDFVLFFTWNHTVGSLAIRIKE